MEQEMMRLQEVQAHQQAEMDQMSREMYAQQQELTALRAALEVIKSKMETMDTSDIRHAAEETPPPHY